MAEDKNTANIWSESAPYWEKHRETIRQMFAPITEGLIADANVTRGSAVLDIGTGPGEPALSVAEFVGSEGKVCGIDPAPEMVAAARRAADHQGLDNVNFEVAPADQLPFAEKTFDAIVSRFAAMFFPAPVAALREILRVLKPGGRMAFAVWSFAETNPFHYILSRVVDRYADPEATPDFRDAFRFATPGKLLANLNDAGAKQTKERLLQFKIEAPLGVEDFWSLRSEMSERLRSKLAKLSPEKRNEVRSQILDGLREYSTQAGMSFPAEVLIVSGRKAERLS